MMLALYYKFIKLKEGKSAVAIDRVAKHMHIKQDELEEERAKAERRMNAYRQMADEQIRHMLDTVMTLSYLEKSATNHSS